MFKSRCFEILLRDLATGSIPVYGVGAHLRPWKILQAVDFQG